MNKLVLSLPLFALRKYVFNNFDKLSVEDFFIVCKRITIPSYLFTRNNILNKNSDVLSYMLDIDKRAFIFFDKDALSFECINKICLNDTEITTDDINKYPMLLDNNNICEKVVSNDPKVVERLNSNQITPRIISILENSSYIPTYDDMKKSSLFLLSDVLLTRAMDNGVVFKKEDFHLNPKLKTYKILLEKAFLNDPSFIVFFSSDKLRHDVIKDALSRGFIPSRKDLEDNPLLSSIPEVMDTAIRNDPTLIKFVKEGCFLNYELVEKVLKTVDITEDDLKVNPDLAKNFSIMCHLPHLRIYSPQLNNEEKQSKIKECIIKNNTLLIKYLPFLDYNFGGKANFNKLLEVFNALKISFDENDTNLQQEYFQKLDKVIDGIASINYSREKFSFKYPDIVSLHNHMIEVFEEVNNTLNYNLILNFIEDLYLFVGKTLSIDIIKKEVNNFYNIYDKDKEINLSITNLFCNKILNYHRNYYLSHKKEVIIDQIKSKTKLTNKKTNNILNGRKLKKIGDLIKQKNFMKIGTNKEELDEKINLVLESISINKDIKKEDIIIDDFVKNMFLVYFNINGSLDFEFVSRALNTNNKKVIRYIINQFEKIKLDFINKVSLTKLEAFISPYEKEKISGLNYNNYMILNNDYYITNLAKLLLELDDDILDKILSNKYLIDEVKYLLPLVDLNNELDIKTFINILSNYERIKYKMTNSFDNNDIYNNIEDVIYLANAYSSIDDLTLFALGKDVVSKVGEDRSKDYLSFYINMLSRKKGSIPPVSTVVRDEYLESGNYSDPDRLLIGKIYLNSCIDLVNPAGSFTYNMTLLDENGDAILIKDKNKKLISRILIFRRGNVVQMISYGQEKHSYDLYKKIADQIMEQAKKSNDNLDYIFVNYNSLEDPLNEYDSVYDYHFISKFPHADMSTSAVILSSKDGIKDIDNLDFNGVTRCSYMGIRKKISYNPSDSDITRLRALSVVMEDDWIKKEEDSRNFEPFYSKGYKRVVCGEDWYLAIKNNGELEEVILPTNDERKYDEILDIKKVLDVHNNIKFL